MSVRFKILGPILVLIAVGVFAAAWISVASIHVNRQTLSNYENVNGQFATLDQTLHVIEELKTYRADILSFNTLVPPENIASRMAEIKAELDRTLTAFETLDADHGGIMDVAPLRQALHTWFDEASIALGLTPASEIPSLPRLDSLADKTNTLATRLRDQAVDSATAFWQSARQGLIFQVAGAFGIIVLVLTATGVFVFLRGAWLANTLQQLAGPMEEIRSGRFDVTLRAKAQDDEVGEIAQGVAAFADTLQDLTQAKSRIEHMAMHDELTGLSNRLRIQELMNWLLDFETGRGDRFAVLHIDLDRFKEVNDTHGHAAGDAVLCPVADLLNAQMQDGDLAARFGGDEFVVVMARARTEEAAADAAQKIIDSLSQPFDFEDQRLRIGASIGIAFSDSANNPERLLTNADIALYLAKGAGRGQYCFFNAQTGDAFARRTELLRDLRQAIDNREIEAFFQPQIDGIAGQAIGAEALARWRHPTRGLLMPGQFLDLVAENGLGDPLTEIIIDKSVAALAKWRADGIDLQTVSVNLAVQQLRSPDMMAHLIQAVERHGLAPEDVAIEIVESVLFGEDSDEEITNICAMQNRGFRIELDDFGTGHASISNLRRIRVDRVKIDRSFVTGVAEDRDQERLLKALIDLCANLEIECLAEGVETETDRSKLVSMGCALFQGYGVAMPMDGAEAQAWFAEQADQANPSGLRA